jgi:hypothetical protein
MTANVAPPRQAPQAQQPSPQQASDAKDGQVSKGKQHWIVINVTEQQSKGLREMARTSGGKAADFYKSLLAPAIDTALQNFSENREVMTARAKAQAAKTAAARAAEIAQKAEEEAKRIESQQK